MNVSSDARNWVESGLWCSVQTRMIAFAVACHNGVSQSMNVMTDIAA